MDIPDTLAHKIENFSESGRLFRKQNDLFLDSSWLQVMVGQGIIPKDYHPIANSVSSDALLDMLKKIKTAKNEPIASLPSHDEFLQTILKGSVS
jgi:tryptophan halogenase